MLYTINELRQSLFSKVYDTYRIFQEFFGEEYTDLQGVPDNDLLLGEIDSLDISESEYEGSFGVSDLQYNLLKDTYSKVFIYVWWPEVTVTNENDRSVKIQDLYARIDVTLEGTIPYENVGFQLNRSTFSNVQWTSCYIHSHVPSRDSHRLPKFQNPCLGTGPIKNTIADLKNNYEELLWMLFCQELSLYVTVESLTGVPYRKLEKIGVGRKKPYTMGYNSNFKHKPLIWYYCSDMCSMGEYHQLFIDFTRYYLKRGTLLFGFADGKYQTAMDYYDFMVDISDAFIKFFNEYGNKALVKYLYKNEIIQKAFVSDRKFLEDAQESPAEVEMYQDIPILHFKDKDITLSIIDNEDSEHQTTLLLNREIALHILYKILDIINYHYIDEHSITISREAGGQSPASTSYQTAFYL